MHIKKTLGKKLFPFLSHKESAILSGVLAQMLLVSAAIGVSKDPFLSIIDIFYAFIVLLPISYYNMRYYEKCEKPYGIE